MYSAIGNTFLGINIVTMCVRAQGGRVIGLSVSMSVCHQKFQHITKTRVIKAFKLQHTSQK